MKISQDFFLACFELIKKISHVAREFMECKITWQTSAVNRWEFVFVSNSRCFLMKNYDFLRCRNQLITTWHFTDVSFLEKTLSLRPISTLLAIRKFVEWLRIISCGGNLESKQNCPLIWNIESEHLYCKLSRYYSIK